jgi:hypothetical protein
MKYWIGLLCIVSITLIFLTSDLIVERFSNANGQTTFIAREQAMPDDTPLYVNETININGLNQVLNTSDGVGIDYKKKFMKDPMIPFRKKDEATCRLARHPRQLTRLPRAKQGCGWWFLPDGISFGALGTIQGPVDRAIPKTYPTGRWYWNLTDAARVEDIKLCKRIKVCEAVTEDCGWCDSQGHAIPILPDGTVKYPSDDTGSCSTTPFRKGMCPVPEPLPSVPILDTNGNVVGESTPQSTPSICSPRNGLLTRECLLALATARGCTATGSIYQMIAKGSNPTEADRVAIDVLSKANIVTLTYELLGGGRVSASSALDAYQAVTNTITSGRSKQIRQAATYLAIGGEEIDMCSVEDNSLGPFSPQCLSIAFRQAGCQASGAKFPRDSSTVRGYTWGGIKQAYRTLAGSMYSTDAFVQADAIQDCIGTNVNPPYFEDRSSPSPSSTPSTPPSSSPPSRSDPDTVALAMQKQKEEYEKQMMLKKQQMQQAQQMQQLGQGGFLSNFKKGFNIGLQKFGL